MPFWIVPSLPTRDGNTSRGNRSEGDGTVPSLPTRDGNSARLHMVVVSASSSQPTYKGWKQIASEPGLVDPFPFPAYLQGMETTYSPDERCPGSFVPSLPTRDGNQTETPKSEEGTGWFPAYLQGMETCGDRSLAGPAWRFPAYLQGMETLRSLRPIHCEKLVPSLPTRDGNINSETYPPS